MSDETLTVHLRIDAPAETVFAVLADPATHGAIDGTGWVREPLDGGAQLTAEGQVFEVAMYHDNHPDKDYRMADKVIALEAPRAIAWEPGQYDDAGELGTGGWIWRYDLSDVGDGSTDVTLTYDWSKATPEVREFIQFPPFPVEHLERSLGNLGDLAVARR